VKPSGSRYQCTTCGEHFTGPHSFARHRTGADPDLQCLTPGAMRVAGMVQSVAGFWTIDRPRPGATWVSEGAP
jgi:hypothetical protein